MHELDILGVRLDLPSRPMLLLRESGGQRCLPIWIGAAEASAIASAMEGLVPPRPLTHDLFAEVLSELGHTEIAGRITGMTDGTFLGELEIDGHVISARPSDVVALAIRAGIVVTCTSELLDQVGVVLESEGDDEVEKFREFLDNVTPDDFEP
ncbi:bifunctional nuclease family protein [Aestuariimicrobium soli]|uniref:bifunctional nuclease family protein n=1 Tax=Aestuariimicrobium soli TaxID=2035834 RepID=UPI003EBEDADA